MNESFAPIYDHLRALEDPAAGLLFEKVLRYGLIKSPLYANYNIERYGEWALRHREKTSDTGIDFVLTSPEGIVTAVQAKFARNELLTRGAVDSFLVVSNRSIFHRRLVVTTAMNFSGPLVEVVKIQELVPIELLNLDGVSELVEDWVTLSEIVEILANGETSGPITSSNELGYALKAARIAMGLSQRELSEKLNRSQRYISEIESGKNKRLDPDLFAYLSHMGVRLSYSRD